MSESGTRTFRHRLLLTLGPALAAALVVLGVVAWFFAYGWLIYSAQTLLDVEIREIAVQITTLRGTLEPGAYNWNEPHHRFDAQHIDPYFLQVFDEQGQLQRASENIRVFPAGTYPDRLLAYQTSQDRMIQRLRTLDVGGRRLYYRTKPVQNTSGDLIGYIQVARYDPGIAVVMKRTTYFLLLGLVPVWLGLLGLVWWSARRVVAPLESITKEARSLAPVHLGRRITIPTRADQETRLLATTLNNQLDQIERAFEEMRRFTADAAHELQTPLTVLLGHVDVALRRERSPEVYKGALRVLHTEIEGLISMVQSLLQLARLDRGEQGLQREPVDLVSLIYNEAPHFIHRAEARGVDFELNLPRRAEIQGQPDLIQKVVINLLDNAVKFTEKGRVSVRINRQDESVQLIVEDTGTGMTTDVRAHATDRFYRAPDADEKRIPGSGLGLAIVKQIINRHGGQLKIDSESGKGTTIVVSMPSSNGRA